MYPNPALLYQPSTSEENATLDNFAQTLPEMLQLVQSLCAKLKNKIPTEDVQQASIHTKSEPASEPTPKAGQTSRMTP